MIQQDLSQTRFAVKAFSALGERPRELTRTMAPHPLSWMELPFDPEYTLYNGRLTPEVLNHTTDDEMYWAVRTGGHPAQHRRIAHRDFGPRRRTPVESGIHPGDRQG